MTGGKPSSFTDTYFCSKNLGVKHPASQCKTAELIESALTENKK